ncbi:MAG: ABC transporter permease [Clostridia bacterium]|nr:ABC transporter permease [Clostridia bacterium]
MENTDNKDLSSEAMEEALDKNVRLMSPGRMVMRRFFRSKLSIVGLVMIVALFVFCWIGPLIYTQWEAGEMDTTTDRMVYKTYEQTYTDGDETHTFYTVTERPVMLNNLAPPDSNHPLGTDNNGYDNLARLMQGGKISLVISFLSVFMITIFGVVFGGLAGYFGGIVDNVIMRVCDILTCLPGFPILLIVGTALMAWEEKGYLSGQYRIYFLMGFLTLISWAGTARLVRGQILTLREQEYMVAAEAMGYSTGRKIFKHLVPNVMPQLIVSMTLSLGSMILYEASLSFLGLGAPEKYAAWGTMINSGAKPELFLDYMNIWVPPGLCIITAVLGFNFIGDGLRDALDPKARR